MDSFSPFSSQSPDGFGSIGNITFSRYLFLRVHEIAKLIIIKIKILVSQSHSRKSQLCMGRQGVAKLDGSESKLRAGSRGPWVQDGQLRGKENRKR